MSEGHCGAFLSSWDTLLPAPTFCLFCFHGVNLELSSGTISDETLEWDFLCFHRMERPYFVSLLVCFSLNKTFNIFVVPSLHLEFFELKDHFLLNLSFSLLSPMVPKSR